MHFLFYELVQLGTELSLLGNTEMMEALEWKHRTPEKRAAYLDHHELEQPVAAITQRQPFLSDLQWQDLRRIGPRGTKPTSGVATVLDEDVSRSRWSHTSLHLRAPFRAIKPSKSDSLSMERSYLRR